MPDINTELLEALAEQLFNTIILRFRVSASLLKETNQAKEDGWVLYANYIENFKVKLEKIKLDAIASGNHKLFMDDILQYYCMIKALITLLRNDLSSQYTMNKVSTVIPPVFGFFHQRINDNAHMLVTRIDYVNGLINNFCDMLQEVLNANAFTVFAAKVRSCFHTRYQ